MNFSATNISQNFNQCMESKLYLN